MSSDEIEEIILDEAFQKGLTKAIIEVGQINNAHPVQFVLALINSAQIICDHENLKLEDLLTLLNDCDTDSNCNLH